MMILLQIFALSLVAGAGGYIGAATAASVHDLISQWRRVRRQC